ncbi:MAG: hypothetical protein ACM3ZF_17075, partial [Mycobacterium leprae]
PLADIAEWLRSGALAGLIDGVRAARKAGVPHTAIRDFVLGFEEFARLLGEAAQALDPADRRKADDGEHRKET